MTDDLKEIKHSGKKTILLVLVALVLIGGIVYLNKGMMFKKVESPVISEKTECDEKTTFVDYNLAIEHWFEACELKLSGQKISSIPPPALQLTNIKSLNLSYNDISDVNNIGAFWKLRFLNLSNNKIEKLPTNSILIMNNLSSLNVSHNNISELMPEASNDPFLTLPNLKQLNLSFNKFKTLPKVIANMQGLAELDISGNPIIIDKDFVPTLSKLRSLDILVISDATAKGAEKQLSSLKENLPNLKITIQ